MAEAVGQSLAFAVGVAISPLPIVAVIMMLSTPRARSNGPAFVAGWVVGILVVGAVVLLLAGGADPTTRGQPADWVSVLKLLLAVLLLVVAFRQWRGRPRGGEEPPMPSWTRALDDFTATRSAGIGFALSGLNPKNLLLVVGGAAAISQTEAGTGAQIGALVVFALIATIGVGTPLVTYLAMGARSARALGEMRSWMATHNAAIMAVICVLIAAKLAGDALSGLAG